MNNLIKGTTHLPVSIEKLIFERIVGIEKIKAYKALLRAETLTGVKQAKGSCLEDAQDLGDYMLDIDVRLGELLSSSVKAGSPIVNPGKQLPPGISRLVSHQAQTLSQHREAVERVKAEAREKGEIPVASRVYQIIKHAEAVKKLESIEAKQAKEIQGVYDVIIIDPPWPMEKIERDVAPNQVSFDYPTMTEEEIRQVNIPMADDCHVWLWTTHKFLPMAFRLLEAWQLKYVCCFVWHKPGGFQPWNLPQYNCELCLYARKGSPSFIDTKNFMVCFNADRGKHSEKPQEFYNLIKRVTGGRRFDMFSRKKIDGFDAWGKEA